MLIEKAILLQSIEMSSPAILNSLTPREAVTDTIHRVLIGIDHNDISLFNASFAGEDVIMELNGAQKNTITGLSAIVTNVFDHIGPMDTTHMIGNARVDIKEGADTASFFAYLIAQHCATGQGRDPGAPKYTVGGEYEVDLIKDGKDGLWKIKKFVVNVIWNQGDASVMAKPI
jgi:hypothetical protein